MAPPTPYASQTGFRWRMYSTSMPPEAKIFTWSKPWRSSSQRTSRIRSKKSPRRLPGVSIRIAEIESGMALAARSAPNFSSSKVSMIMVRGTSGSMISSKARAASAVEPRTRTRAWGVVPVAGVARTPTGRVHPARAEGDHGLLTGGEPAAGRPCSHPRGLAEQTEYRRLVFCESAVGARERQDRFVGTADRTFWDGPRIDLDAVE